MWIVLNRMKNEIHFFFRFLFLKLSWKFIENWGDDVTKMIIARKVNIGKIWNLIFLSIQLIPDLSCNFFLMHVYMQVFLNAVDANLFQLGSTNPKKNSQTFHVIFGSGLSDPPKKNRFFFISKKKMPKFSNSHEWSGIDWIEKKNSDLCVFYFSSSGHFFTQNDSNFRWIFIHNSKNKNEKIYIYISFFIIRLLIFDWTVRI